MNDSANENNKSMLGTPDVILVVDGNRIACHRKLLAEHSHYFCAMFSSDFIEKNQQEISIEEVDGFTLRLLIDLAYGSPFTLEKDESVVIELLKTAVMLQFSGIQEQCVQILLRNLNLKNSLSIWSLSELLGLVNLTKQTFKFILHNFNSIITQESNCLFSQLSEELLHQVLSHTHLNCENEKSILRVISNWIDEQATEIPESKIIQLLYCVRFKSLNCNDLKEVATLPFIQTSNLLSQLLSAIILKLKDTEDVDERHEKCKRMMKEGTSKLCSSSESDVLFEAPYSVENRQSSHRFPCFSLSDCCKGNERRRTSDDIQTANSYANAQAFSPEILNLMRELLNVPARQLPLVPCVVGHVRCPEFEIGNVTLTTRTTATSKQYYQGPSVLAFNLKTLEFENLVNLTKVHGSVEASGYKVCAIGGNVYIFGGEFMLGYSNWQNSVWKWDGFKNHWSIDTTLLSPRRHHSLCVHEEYIYLLGGYGKFRIVLDSVDRYNTLDGSWKRCCPLPRPLYSVACCSHEGKIYIFSDQVFTYDPQSDEWQTLANVTIPRDLTFSQALSTNNDGIYLTCANSNQLYHFCTDALSEIRLIGIFEHSVLCCCIYEPLNAIVCFSAIDDSVVDSPPDYFVEMFDLSSKSFSKITRKPSATSLISDLGVRHRHILGCFSLISFSL